MQGLLIDPGSLPPECEALRAEVRSFLAEAMKSVPPARRNRNWSGASPEFSRAMGERGLHWLNEHISPAAWNQQFDEIIRKTLKQG